MSENQDPVRSDSSSLSPILVVTTLPAKCEDIWLRELVESGLAGCITKLPGAVSIFNWQNVIDTANETLYLIKTIKLKLPELIESIKHHHPYEVPEIIALDPYSVNPEYSHWLCNSVTRKMKPLS